MAEPVEGLLPDPVPDHPLLNGRKEIGRGEHHRARSADREDGQERVYKVLSSPADYAYYTAEDRPTSHFPVVYADHGTAGRSSRGFPFHIVEVERLYPLQLRGYRRGGNQACSPPPTMMPA